MESRLMMRGHVFAEIMKTDRDVRMPNLMEHEACLYYVIEGKGEVYSPLDKIEIETGDSVLMKCGNYIGCFLDVTPDKMHTSIGFHFHPTDVKKLVVEGRLSFDQPDKQAENLAVKFSGNAQLDNYVRGLIYYLDNPNEASEEIIELKMLELLVILIESGRANQLLSGVLNRLYQRQEIEFHRVIEANLYNNLSIGELAILTNRSDSTFKRDFKKYFKVSPAKYFRQKRIERAAELLYDGRLQINEIAWDCGFESAAHFSKTFFDQYGKWPRDFRTSIAMNENGKHLA